MIIKVIYFTWSEVSKLMIDYNLINDLSESVDSS